MDLSMLHSKVGTIIMASAVIDDLVGWSLFAVILGVYHGGDGHSTLWPTVGIVLGFVLLVLGLGRWIGQPLVRRVLYGTRLAARISRHCHHIDPVGRCRR